MWEEWESLYTGDGRQGKRGKKRKRRRRHRILKSIFCIALIIPVFMAVLWAKNMISGRSSLAVMALVNPKVREIMANKDRYPEQLIELLQNNEETVDFVFDYPKRKIRLRQTLSVKLCRGRSRCSCSGMNDGDTPFMRTT